MTRNSISWSACVLVSAGALWAQSQGEGASQGESLRSGSRGGGSQSASGQSNTQSGTRTADPIENRRTNAGDQGVYRRGPDQPFYLYGRVVTEDGKPPSERVVVKMNCGAAVAGYLLRGSFPQDVTDSKGRFNFYPGTHSAIRVADASSAMTSGMRGYRDAAPEATLRVRNLSNCVLHVELPGYRSDRSRLRDFRGMGALNVGILVLHRLDGVKGSAFSPATLAAPRAAAGAFHKGVEVLLNQDPKHKQAIRHLEKAVKLYPQFAAAWWALGEARAGLKDAARAREAYTRSMHADPNYLRPYEPLIDAAFQRKDWPALESLGERYLALSPASPEIRYRVAVAAINQGKTDTAERMAMDIVARGEANEWPRIHVILGLVHENQSEFGKAAESYRDFLKTAPNAPLADTVKNKLAELGARKSIRQ